VEKWLKRQYDNEDEGESVKKRAHPETPKWNIIEWDSPLHALTLNRRCASLVARHLAIAACFSHVSQ
jgi:hypothetical protein